MAKSTQQPKTKKVELLKRNCVIKNKNYEPGNPKSSSFLVLKAGETHEIGAAHADNLIQQGLAKEVS